MHTVFHNELYFLTIHSPNAYRVRIGDIGAGVSLRWNMFSGVNGGSHKQKVLTFSTDAHWHTFIVAFILKYPYISRILVQITKEPRFNFMGQN